MNFGNIESSFTDLVNGTFDLSQFVGKEKNEKIYKAVSETNIGDDDKSVQYIYNDNFFRSDNFIKNHEGVHILFSGCSESEGVGSNIENAWTHILYSKISKEINCSGFFNLSRSGWGWSKIVINALIYFEQYGYPDFYFILLPNHLRMHKFFKDGTLSDAGELAGNWKYLQYYPGGYSKDKKSNLATEEEYRENFMYFITCWKIFNKVCKDNNIKLFFATWDTVDNEMIQSVNMFDNFINIPYKNIGDNKEFNNFMINYYKNNQKTKFDIKKRDGHHGILMHNFWAEQFYKEYSKNV